MSIRAFVSSTYKDLAEHRAYVIAELRRAGVQVDPMEDWTAASEPPKQFSRERLEGCELCVLLVAFRRGHVPQGDERSITQLEYDYARAQRVDVLVFMLDEQAPWPRQHDELDSDAEVRRWRASLRERHGVQAFDNEPESIDVVAAVARWISARKGRTAPVGHPPGREPRAEPAYAPLPAKTYDETAVQRLIVTCTACLILLVVIMGLMYGIVSNRIPMELLANTKFAGFGGVVLGVAWLMMSLLKVSMGVTGSR